jgi:adenine-specific DNA methylase
MSAWREFEAKFLSLSKESERTTNRIDFVSGPWRKTVQTLKSDLNKDVLFYVDAPYKREEYSRYYHALETLVDYNYPSIFGKGRQPYKDTKIGGERFSSEFFTKNAAKVEAIFVELFVEILSTGWKCAWSYSSNGIAQIENVLEKVSEITDCLIISFSTPYKHKSQNKPSSDKPSTINVEEYLFLMTPKR